MVLTTRDSRDSEVKYKFNSLLTETEYITELKTELKETKLKWRGSGNEAGS